MSTQPPPTSAPSASPKKPLTAHQTRKLDPSTSSKPCSHCQTPSDVLIRCQTRLLGENDPEGRWYLLCPGKCWLIASGGVVDGSDEARRKGYKYGGVWKNKKGAVSGKKPKGKYNRPKKGQEGGEEVDDRVREGDGDALSERGFPPADSEDESSEEARSSTEV